MRVICVARLYQRDMTPGPLSYPEVGDECAVVSTHNTNGNYYFELAEYGPEKWYNTKCFATLPEATADEMEAEVKEAILM